MAGKQARLTPALLAYIVFVLATGAAIIVYNATLIQISSLSVYAILLAALTISSDRIVIKMPGRPASVSVSELFIFASILLFGPAVPILTVAIGGLWVSLTQKNRRLYRALFNIAEPAISVWAAAYVFFAVAGVAPGSRLSTGMPLIVPATIAMAGVFFALNSGLSAVALALENATSVYQVWRGHAWYLAINYYAAASLATLLVSSGTRINFGAVGLVAPLLALSYVAYREASSRIDEAQRHVADVEHLYRAAIETLAIAVDAKDQVTHGHIRRVQRHTLAVAAALGVTDARELKAIEAGALLHDIGKLAVPDYVLNKPGTLTSAEFETMKKHASMGARILTAVEFPYPVVPIVRHHHERWDGGGYPDGLVGAEIPLGARILAVVDCFDALTSDRPYRGRLTDAQAAEILEARRGTFYDPVVVQKFVQLIPELRRSDALSGEAADMHASLVAGLAGATKGRFPDVPAPEPALLPSAVHPIAQELIDEHVVQAGGADACLFSFDASQGSLVVAHATPRIRHATVSLRIPVASGVSGWVAANRNAIRFAEASLDLGELANTLSLKSCASVPVFVRTELFGVLTMYAADGALADEKIEALGLVAQEVALAIARGAVSSVPARSRQLQHRTSHLSIAAAS
jgi:putative nucleotidyltransferase with HDIG domain